MARFKVFRRLNDNKLNSTWQPIIESYGGDLSKTPWLAEYAHYHAIFDNTPDQLFESAPGLFFSVPTSVPGLGNPLAPTPAQTPFSGGAKTPYSASGSGDKFPSLLPIAIQVAAKTEAFNFVSVIPIDSPVGFLPYIDYVYAGGRTDTEHEPYIIKLVGITKKILETRFNLTGVVPGAQITFVDSSNNNIPGTYHFIGFSRVDGYLMIKIVDDGNPSSNNGLASVLELNYIDSITSATTLPTPPTIQVPQNSVQLVSALENHISGFTSVSDANYATTAFTGPYLGPTGSVPKSMTRGESESSKFRKMGLKMFTKFVEAETDQVAITATVEQIQDLNRVWNYDAISMLENVSVNEIAQSINKKLTDKVFVLADAHASEIELVEGTGITDLNLNAGVGGFENISTLQRRFVTKILELASLIFHRGRFGSGTFLVTNGRMASALADVAGYSIAQFPSEMGVASGNLYPAGKVYGLQVYVDPNLSWGDTRVAIGRKGADEEPGIKFLPYIMAESLQTINQSTLSPIIGIKSRYCITEAGWHPETQYVTMKITGNPGVLTGSVAPTP